MDEELVNRFRYHPARAQNVKDKHQQVRDVSALMASVIVELTPRSREQSLALTKIEEAMMWATASVARDPANAAQETDPFLPAQLDEETDPLELLTDQERSLLPFVLRDDMSAEQAQRIGHLHGKDGRCIRNRYGPLCIDPGSTEGTGPKINIVHDDDLVVMAEHDILARANDDDPTGMQPPGFN